MRLDRAILGISLCVLGYQSLALGHAADEEHSLRGPKLRGHKAEGPAGHGGDTAAIENVRGPVHHLHLLNREEEEAAAEQEEAKPFDRRRGLFMDVPEPGSEEFKALNEDGDGKKRTLFMDIPDDEQDPHHHDTEGKRSLAVDPSGVMTQLLNVGDSLPLFAFPGLQTRSFASEALLKQGHNSFLSRLLMLAEVGDAFEREKR